MSRVSRASDTRLASTRQNQDSRDLQEMRPVQYRRQIERSSGRRGWRMSPAVACRGIRDDAWRSAGKERNSLTRHRETEREGKREAAREAARQQVVPQDRRERSTQKKSDETRGGWCILQGCDGRTILNPQDRVSRTRGQQSREISRSSISRYTRNTTW